MKIKHTKQTFKIASIIAIISLTLTGCNALHTPKNVNFLAFENPVNSPETVEWIKSEKSK
jgi:hypothetical protein